jgi:hypothetical protein
MKQNTTVTVVTGWPMVQAVALNVKTGRRFNVSVDATRSGVRAAKKQARAMALKGVK